MAPSGVVLYINITLKGPCCTLHAG
jgi:hypothetical protein